MPRSRDEVTVDFDHHLPLEAADPDEALADLQRACPVAWTEANDGYWVVTRYTDVDRVLKDYRFFTSNGGITIPKPRYGESALVDYDPPRHTAYRRPLNATLTREFVAERVQSRIEHWTDVCLDRVIEAGRCDLMYDIAVAIPAAVTLEWLGWENRDEWWGIGEAWHDMLSRPFGDPRYEHGTGVVSWFDGRIREELDQRRAEPRDDPLTTVALMEVDGKPIPPEHGVSIVRILIGAGVDTTTSLIGSALVHLHFHPDQRRRLQSEPGLWPTAAEEFIRRFTPARNISRTCVQEVELGGCTIAPGERVLASIWSGNLDGEVFDDPLEVTLDRSPNAHLGFGSGVHRCIGLHLARAEFLHVASSVLQRMPDYRVVENELVRYARQSEVHGWMKAPAVFTPGVKVRPDSQDALTLGL
jgi:cytochrome P450